MSAVALDPDADDGHVRLGDVAARRLLW